MHELLRLCDPAGWLNRPDARVGLRGTQVVLQAEFVLRLQAWRGRFARARGQKFALYFEDSLEFAAALLGAWQAGKTVFLSADTLPASCAALRHLVHGFAGEFDAQYAPMQLAADALAAAHIAPPLARLSPDLAALVVQTSGSTGDAQAIPKTLGQLAQEVETLERSFGALQEGARIVATVSHHHMYGLLFKLLWPLAYGREIVAHSAAFPEQLLPLLATPGCVLVTTPAQLKRLPEHVGWTRVAPTLRMVFSSGGPLSWESARDNTALLGRPPFEIYGSSETGSIAWRQRDSEAHETWAPFTGIRWRLAQPEGVLELQSPNLPAGSWFRLADRVVSEAGGFVLKGRADRIVKIEEKRISLDAIERLLLSSALVEQARVLLPDGGRQRTAAFVVLSAEGRALLDEIGKLALNLRLRALLSAAIEPVALPRSWRFLDALPTNAVGKTTQAALLALLGEAPRLPHYRLLERSSQRCVYELIAPRELVYFAGHFAEAPVLPGVVQIDWAIHFSRRTFPLPAHFRGMQLIKFQRIITPEMTFSMALDFDAQKSCVDFRLFSSGEQHSSGRLLFGEVAHV